MKHLSYHSSVAHIIVVSLTDMYPKPLEGDIKTLTCKEKENNASFPAIFYILSGRHLLVTNL